MEPASAEVVRWNGSNMMVLGKPMVLSESMRRNLFLLPGVALLGCVLLADSCSSQKSSQSDPKPDFSAAKTVMPQEAAKSPAGAVTEAPTGKATRPLAVGGQPAQPR